MMEKKKKLIYQIRSNSIGVEIWNSNSYTDALLRNHANLQQCRNERFSNGVKIDTSLHMIYLEITIKPF